MSRRLERRQGRSPFQRWQGAGRQALGDVAHWSLRVDYRKSGRKLCARAAAPGYAGEPYCSSQPASHARVAAGFSRQ